VYEENQQLTASPEIAAEIAKMDYQLKMAAQFSKSGAFPKMSPEQIYTVMKSGEEMGLKPIEALQTLYVVNGSIKPYGDKMIAMLRKKGYKIEYVSEDNTHCLVRIFNKDETYSETARADDPVLRNSKAMKFAPKQKLRFHAVRQIVSFHLPHLFGSVTDEFTSDFREWEEENKPEMITDFTIDEIDLLIEKKDIPIFKVEEIKQQRDYWTEKQGKQCIFWLRSLEDNLSPIRDNGGVGLVKDITKEIQEKVNRDNT